jgi:putative ABC transport system permease protein
MKLWINLAIRNVTRNVRRTALTVATVLVATALVTLALSWIAGLTGGVTADFTAVSGHVRIVDEDFAAREALQPLYENIADAAPVLEALRATPGVVDAQPRITTGVVITAGEEIGDNFTMAVGATDDYYRRHLHGPEKVITGAWLSGAEKEVVLGRKLAAQLRAAVGTKVLLLGQTQNGSMSPISAVVVGIAGGDAMIDQQAFLSLEDLRWLADMPGGALEVLVWTDRIDPAVIAPVVDRIRALPSLKGLAFQPWYEREPWATSLKLIHGVNGFIQFLIVFVAALAIFNTMTMSVLERTTEIGVMRAMGLTRPGAVGLFVLEGLVIGLIGGLAGTLCGSMPAWYLEVHGVTLAEQLVERVGNNMPMHATVYADLSPQIASQAVMLGLVIAVLGAVLPAMRAAAIPPVTAMRARR